MRSAAVRSLQKKQITAAACSSSNAFLSILPPTISATGRTQAPASFAQQRIWLDEQTRFDPSVSAPVSVYHCVLPLYVKVGTIPIERVRSALIDVLKWHTILRTAVYFNYETGQLEQKVMPNSDESFSFQITHNIQTEAQLDALFQSESNTPFARLDQGLVVRCNLIQVGDDAQERNYMRKDDVILFVFHHIAYDLASIEPFIAAFVQAHYHVIELSAKNMLQYIDFTLYEQNQLADPSAAINRAHSFWSTLMGDYQWNGRTTLSVLSQTANKISATRSGHSHTVTFDLDEDIVEEQMRFSSVNNISMFQLGISCYFLFLHMLSYQKNNDLCIQLMTENRPLVELKSMIGVFVNIIPYRLQLDEGKSFVDMVQQIRRLWLQIYEHSHLPYQKIIDCISDKRPPSFRISFQYESSVSNITYDSGRNVLLDGAEVCGNGDQYLWRRAGVTVFDLSLTLSHSHSKRTTQGCFECAADLIDKMTIDNLAIQFQHVCRQLFGRNATNRQQEPISLLCSSLQQEVDDLGATMFKCLPAINCQGSSDT